jgi:hypothetical protein
MNKFSSLETKAKRKRKENSKQNDNIKRKENIPSMEIIKQHHQILFYSQEIVGIQKHLFVPVQLLLHVMRNFCLYLPLDNEY